MASDQDNASSASSVDDEELYQHCFDTVAMVKSLRDLESVHQEIGAPIQLLPITGFFVTHTDLSVTPCDLVELYHYRQCAIRIGYIKHQIEKVRGMPLIHWKPPPKTVQ